MMSLFNKLYVFNVFLFDSSIGNVSYSVHSLKIICSRGIGNVHCVVHIFSRKRKGLDFLNYFYEFPGTILSIFMPLIQLF